MTKKFLKEGFKVIGTIVPNDPVQLSMDDPNFETASVNLMEEDEADKFVQQVIEKYKTIDAAVLTVGGFVMGTIAETKIGKDENRKGGRCVQLELHSLEIPYVGFRISYS